VRLLSYLEKFQCKKKKCNKEVIVPVQIIKKESYFAVQSRCPICSKKYKHKLPIKDKVQWLDLLRDNFPRSDSCGAVNKHLLKLQRDDLEASILKMVFDIPHKLGIQCLNCDKLRKKVISRGCWNDVVDYNPKVQVVSTARRGGPLILDLDMEKTLAESKHYSQIAETARQEKRYNDFILDAFEMLERLIKFHNMKWLGGYERDSSIAELINDLRTKIITLPQPAENLYWQDLHDKVSRGIYNLVPDEAQKFSRYLLMLRMPLDDFLRFDRENQPSSILEKPGEETQQTRHPRRGNISHSSSISSKKDMQPNLHRYNEREDKPRKSLIYIVEEVRSVQPRRENVRTCPFCGIDNILLLNFVRLAVLGCPLNKC